MSWSHITPDGKIIVSQQKTGRRLLIPLHRDLLATLAAVKREHISILTTMYGKPFTVIADIAKRMGFVPLVTEKPDSSGFYYDIVENFCPVTLKETGETGYALVEIGFQTKKL